MQPKMMPSEALFRACMDHKVPAPPSGRTVNPPPGQRTATDEELAAELKRRRKIAREQKALEAARAAAATAAKERGDAIRNARSEKHSALTLLSLVGIVESGGAPHSHACLCEFEKELTPLAKQFGYRIVRVGDGNRATIVKL